MKHTKFATGMAVLLCVISLAGCGGDTGAQSPSDTAPEQTAPPSAPAETGQDIPDTADPETDVPNTTTPEQESSADGSAATDATEDADALLESADLSGNVVTVSDGGFVLSPQTESEDGTVTMAVADAAETDSSNVSVVYQENCRFQTARIDTSTGTASCTDASAGDLKSQSSVIVFGEYQESGEFLAERVVVTVYG